MPINYMLRFIFILCLIFTLSSCHTTFYIPNAQNVPLHSEAGQIQFRGGLSEGPSAAYNPDFHLSYAITDHWAVMTNFTDYVMHKSPNVDGRLLEAGGGYYDVIGDSRWVWEVYAGYGNGWGRHHNDFHRNDFSLHRVFLQPDIGYTSDYFDLALSLRISSLHYYRISQTFTPDDSYSNFIDYDLSQNRQKLTIEPALTLRGGYKYIKIQLQLLLAESIADHHFPMDNAVLNIGLSVDLKPSLLKSSP